MEPEQKRKRPLEEFEDVVDQAMATFEEMIEDW